MLKVTNVTTSSNDTSDEDPRKKYIKRTKTMPTCRLCLKSNTNYVNASHGRLRTLVHRFFDFWINFDDESHTVCTDCVDTVMTFFKFCKQVYRVQKNFSTESTINISLCENTTNPIELQVEIKTDLDEVPICKIEESNDGNTSKIDDQVKENVSKNCDLSEFNENLVHIKEVSVEFCSENIKEEPMEFCSENITEFHQESDDRVENITEFHRESNDKVENQHVLSTDADNSKILSIDDEYQSNSEPTENHVMNLKISKVETLGVLKTDSYTIPIPTELNRNRRLLFKEQHLVDAINNFYDLSCTICDGSISFGEFSNLYNHYELEHRTSGYLVCCDSKLFTKDEIVTHMASHAFQMDRFPDSEKGEVFPCKVCEKILKSYESLWKHVVCDHEDANHRCSECGITFPYKSSLEGHMLKHKPKVLEIKCHICGIRFENHYYLRSHISRHAFVFRCSLCNFYTSLADALKSHMREKHPEDKYRCTICDKQFIGKRGWLAHMGTHTVKWKYKCAFCPKTFNQSGNYAKHRRRMHSKELENKDEFKNDDSAPNVDLPA